MNQILKVTPHLTKDEVKLALKEAIKEWLEEKFAILGKWTFRGIMALAIGAMANFIIAYYGWKSPF